MGNSLRQSYDGETVGFLLSAVNYCYGKAKNRQLRSKTDK